MPKIFVPQAISDIATERLHTLGDVTIWPGTDGPMPKEDIIAAVQDVDVMYALGEVEFDKDVIDAARELKFVAAMHMKATFVDQAACTARGIPVSGLPNFVSKTAADTRYRFVRREDRC